jgi:5,10-methenyltetrahydromethanopterin hydrogenase
MTSDEALFSALAAAVCQAIVANIIEMRSALTVLVQRGLISGSEIESAKQQAPPELVRRLQEELHKQVMKTMQEQYQAFLAGPKGPVQ